MTNDSLQQLLERTCRGVLEDRMKTWMKYEFEKVMLPSLLKEATERLRVECFTNANIPEELRVILKFEKTRVE